jgi:hypothetical protein
VIIEENKIAFLVTGSKLSLVREYGRTDSLAVAIRWYRTREFVKLSKIYGLFA